MKIREVQSYKDWRKIKQLYDAAFPSDEKKPFWMIRLKHKQNAADVWVLEEENEFAGLAITMNGGDMVLLDYFAIVSGKRGRGIGSLALEALQKKYSNRRFFLEIEQTGETSDNQSERVRRKKFYLANGMRELGVYVTLFGVDMELLGHGCSVSFQEYRGLYYNTYGNRVIKNVVQR